MSGILVFVEHLDGEADRLSLEALALAGTLAGATGGSVEAVLVGASARDATASLAGHGVSRAHVIEDERLDAYAPAAWGAALAGLVRSQGPAAVVAAGSDHSTEVLAHAAARLDLPMAANVLSVDPGSVGGGGPWQLTRQRWAGSLLEDATLDGEPRLLTVAAHAVPAADSAGGAAPEVVAVTPDVDEADLRARVVGHEPLAAGTISLGDAKVVVGGGRGVGSAEAFSKLEDLATILGGTVGVSRAVTSLGWRPHTQQVGQTGTRIAPDVYIACGISGAIQHIVGCKAAKRILAINTDPDSPIMGVADYAVIGDLNAIVPAISDEIRRRTGAA
jgi:electron transfer flavoprotein alpha subunit